MVLTKIGKFENANELFGCSIAMLKTALKLGSSKHGLKVYVKVNNYHLS